MEFLFLVHSLLLMSIVHALLDTYQSNIFFSGPLFANTIELVVGLLLFFTLRETVKTNRHIARQTELNLRPYLKIYWEDGQLGDNRRDQGITDTCLVASNEGHGLMRSVKYTVKVNGVEVGVRNHSLIKAGEQTNIVYNDATNTAKEALGSRNDKNYHTINVGIIKKDKIKVYGSYRDVEGGKYAFSFDSDPTQQLWFSENYRQELKDR